MLGTDESGVFNLQITNASLADEAVYECQVGPNGTNKPIRASAKLNVLCKPQHVWSNLLTVDIPVPPTKAELVGHKAGSELVVKEEEEVELRCIIHNARPKPDIIWYLGDEEFVRGIRNTPAWLQPSPLCNYNLLWNCFKLTRYHSI